MDNIFMEKKKRVEKKKKIAAARLASILAIRWTGNIIFCMDSLSCLHNSQKHQTPQYS